MQSETGENRPLIFLSQITRTAIEIACEAFAVQVHEMNSRRRQRATTALARQVAIYLSHVVGQLTMTELARAFDRDRSTVAYACHIVEDRRDARLFDAQIEALETEMRRRLERMFARIPMIGAPTALDVSIARSYLSRRRTG